jgi:threonine-phosphate decarboxylase
MGLDTHGGLNLSEMRSLGIDPASLIDFSVNVNPFGPSPRALAALRAFDPAHYPDRGVLQLREALADVNGLASDNVLVGNGTAELIWLVAHAFVLMDNPVLIVGSAFGEYERAARAAGADVTEIRAAPPTFQLSADHLIAEIASRRPRLVFLCNPNNPTGLHLSDADVRRIAEACADGLLILDEAYRSFVTLSPFGPPPTANTIVLRSMTKDFALAGLRLGYALGESQLLQAMRAFQPPWSVNGAAQAAGLAGLGDLDYLRHTLELTRQSAQALRIALSNLGARVLPAPTHFILIEVGDGAVWRRQLMAEACLVRDCASFGLPLCVRVGARRPEENQQLIQAWAKLNSPQGD